MQCGQMDDVRHTVERGLRKVHEIGQASHDRITRGDWGRRERKEEKDSTGRKGEVQEERKRRRGRNEEKAEEVPSRAFCRHMTSMPRDRVSRARIHS